MDQLYFCIHTYIIPLEYIGECSCHRYVSIYECLEKSGNLIMTGEWPSHILIVMIKDVNCNLLVWLHSK